MAAERYHFTFLRHGESVGNREKRFQGQADFPLTETGQSQAKTLAEHWQQEGKSFDRVISSPLVRARQTAGIICDALHCQAQLEPDWMEIDNGLLAGMTDDEAEERVPPPPFFTPYTRIGKTGESRWELFLRAGRNIQKLLDNPAKQTLVVSHGGILTMTMYVLLGIPVQANHSGPRFYFHNTGFATLSYDPTRHTWQLHHFGPYCVQEAG